MRFSAEWVEGGENASPEERATLCELAIHVDGRNVAAFYDLRAKQESGSILMPAVHLAEGIAGNWWRIFGARDVAHRILRWRTGFALPDVRLEFNGSAFLVSCHASAMENPDLWFVRHASEAVARDSAEAALSTFVDDVVAKMSDCGVAESEVALTWARVRRSLADAGERAFCEAAGALGTDPYAIAQADAELIETAAECFEGESLIEFLAGLQHDPLTADDRAKLVDWVHRRRPSERSRLPDLPGLADQVDPAAKFVLGHPPWRRGQSAARSCRNALSIGDTEAVTVKSVAERLGAKRFQREQGPPGLVALVARDDGQVHVHLRHRGRAAWAQTAEKFAFARAIGDAVCFPRTRRAPINDLHHAERQAVGRAFAAEFTAPSDAVLCMWRDDRDVDEIAGHFGVSSRVIENEIGDSQRRRSA